MVSPVHKYYCVRCHLDRTADSPALLAAAVNRHNTLLHPADFSNWNEKGIVLSAQYRGPDAKTVVREAPPVRVPVMEITAADQEWLAKTRVKW